MYSLKLKKQIFSKEIINNIPDSPGIYIFWGTDKNPLYVGKSVMLRNRVKSYLAADLEIKTAKMVSEANFISFIKVNSELESLLLEAKLIHLLRPPYNIELKDDKHPLYIKITKDEYPLVLTARHAEANINSSATFGPFPSSANVKSVLRMLRKIFPYAQHKPGKKACLYYQLGLCDPCPSVIEDLSNPSEKKELKKIYKNNIFYIKKVLIGNMLGVKKNLEKQMSFKAKELEFEKADIIKTKINQLDYITQKVIPVADFLRNPNLTSDLREKEVRELKYLLKPFYPNLEPKRIECYDISHLSGSSATASMVTFINGEAAKNLYRHFKIKQKSGQNDTASLKEVALRRKKHFTDWGYPDLFVVDGGKAQVASFYEAISDTKIPLVGLAKRFETLVIPQLKDGKLIYTEYVLKRGAVRDLLQRIRNESHRFARRLHLHLIRKNLLRN